MSNSEIATRSPENDSMEEETLPASLGEHCVTDRPPRESPSLVIVELDY
jgi:hypothetical protein